MDDTDLVNGARSGDDRALADIYGRYADRVHDFATAVLRDDELASAATTATFRSAADHLHLLEDPTRLRTWLFAIARREVVQADRERVAPTGPAVVDAGADEGTRLAALVWHASAALGIRERVVMDLSLRQGLEGQDLADALGVSLSDSYVLLANMREDTERQLGAHLVANLGQERCPDLAKMVRSWDCLLYTSPSPRDS